MLPIVLLQHNYFMCSFHLEIPMSLIKGLHVTRNLKINQSTKYTTTQQRPLPETHFRTSWKLITIQINDSWQYGILKQIIIIRMPIVLDLAKCIYKYWMHILQFCRVIKSLTEIHFYMKRPKVDASTRI